MKKAVLLFVVCSLCLNINPLEAKKNAKKPSDPQATERTVVLYNRLFKLLNKGVMLAHQDDLAYGYQNHTPGASDVKAITGDYPAVIGWELGHLEQGADKSLDAVLFDDIRKGIIETDARGGINTMSWHGNNIVTGGSAWDCNRKDVVHSVLPGQYKHDEYIKWLDRLVAFFNTLKDKKGEYIPIVFRLYHEHNGSWFWWGARQSTPEDYIALWKMTVDYFHSAGVHHILFSYSPSTCSNEAEYLERYPGDDYVDVIGFDAYQNGDDENAIKNYCRDMRHNLDILTTYATKADKIPAITETGWEGIKKADYFTSVIAPLLEPYKVSWVLFWRNAWEPGNKKHFFLPYKGHPAADDLKKMVSQPRILMNRDIK